MPTAAPRVGRDPDETELLAWARRKDADSPRAYAQLVHGHQAWLVRHLTFVLKSQSDAEDVAQETFARAYLALDRAAPTESFRAWLRVIATRLALNRKRDEATRRKYEEQVEISVRDDVSLGEDAELAARLLARVSLVDRQILMLKYVDDLSVEEIARTLGIGLSATKMRLQRARRALLEAHQTLEGSTE